MEPALQRSLGLGRATAMVIGTIIGASIFVQPSAVTGAVQSLGGVFLVWIATGALTLCGALVCAELASAYPSTGGVYVFLKEAFGPDLGFLWGWAMFWSMHSGIIAAIAVVFARYAGYIVPLGDAGIKTVAIAAILALTLINYWGVRQGSALQTAFTAGKLVAIAGILLLGFWLGSRLPQHFVVPATPGESHWVPALVAGLFTYGGWHMVTYTAGETYHPERTIPRALVIGTLVVTACYVALNAVYLYVLPLEQVASSTRVAADAADRLLGRGGGTVLSVLVMFSTFGGLSGIILTGPRVYYSMARDGLLFRWMDAVHPRFHTPHRAIVLQGIWSSVLVATGTYQTLFTRVVYTEWIFFALMAIGLFLLRRREGTREGGKAGGREGGYAPRYQVPGYPLVPALFVISSLLIVANQVWADLRHSAWGLALVLVGWPVYRLWVWWRAGDEARAASGE